ncbi:hypothetical protein ACFL96_07700 [Thermoproteota archaeon]
MAKLIKSMRRKKAVFFMIDALIAGLILLVGLVLITKGYMSDQPTVTLNYLAQDVLNVLNQMTVTEINNSYVQELIDNGTIDHLNNTLLDQIGEFWAGEDLSLAQEFIENVTYGLIPIEYGFGITINDEYIYKRTDQPDDTVVTARKIVSGIEKSLPVRGYVSRAVAKTVDKNATLVVPFSPVGSGWFVGTYTSVKWFNFTGDYTVQQVTFFVSAHIGSNDDDLEIDINDKPGCHFDVDNMSVERSESYPGQGRGLVGAIDVPTSCLINGINNVTMIAHNNQYNSHLHPGTFMVINYKNNDIEVGELTSTVSNKIYFDDVISTGSGLNGVFEIVPFDIPETATNISVSIQVNTKNVNDYNGNLCCDYQGKTCVLRCKAVDYRIFLNTDSTIHTIESPNQDDIYYYGPENTSQYIINGTNVVAVYLSTYNDQRFGYDDVEIYSNPYNDPENSSYVEVNYTYTVPVTGGVIEVRRVEPFGGDWDTPKEGSFSFPQEAETPSSVYVHMSQIFSAEVKAESDTSTPPSNQIFLSPGVRVTPTSVYIPSETISADYAVTNYIRLEDTFGDPREFGPNTSIDYGFYLKSFVAYAGVFNTPEEASQDAQDRLEEMLGPYIDLENVEFFNVSLTEVPSLWGPAIVSVNIWR